MNDKKKKYVLPEVDIVDFTNEDIITESLTTNEMGGLNWGDDDNTESM